MKKAEPFLVPPIIGFLLFQLKLFKASDWWQLKSADSICFLPRPGLTEVILA
jgi:hypothetical protein